MAVKKTTKKPEQKKVSAPAENSVVKESLTTEFKYESGKAYKAKVLYIGAYGVYEAGKSYKISEDVFKKISEVFEC